VCECNREASIMRGPWPTGAVAPWKEVDFRNPYGFNVESDSTALSFVASRMSSSTRRENLQCFMLVFCKLLPPGD
jgi:hypothetical protein